MGTNTTRLQLGDTRPLLLATLFNPDGSAVNLSGATVAFRMRNAVSRALVINDQPATILSAGEGRVRYTWLAADTDTAGEFESWFVVTYGAGEVESFPNRDSHKVRVEP